MQHKVTFYPVGNADCCLIELDCGKRILFDYAATKSDQEDDKRCDLPELLGEALGEKDSIEFVAFSHLDQDHYRGASEFFWLEYATMYQGDDRIKIGTMWVPAGLILESIPRDDVNLKEARIIQSEARHRFKEGKGIRVFARPDAIEKYCKDKGIPFDDRKKLIVDAGKRVPGLTTTSHGVEFFVHSPFAFRLDEDTVEDRNSNCLVMQATFTVGKKETKLLLTGDVPFEALEDIISITKSKGNEKRLEWDINAIPHHCSYRSLSDEDGKDKTKPSADIKWLYEDKQQRKAIIVSSSNPIPKKGSKEDNNQPPHRQAAAYYKSVVEDSKDKFRVTMSYPKEDEPEPIVIVIDEGKSTLTKRDAGVGAAAYGRRAPRAGQ